MSAAARPERSAAIVPPLWIGVALGVVLGAVYLAIGWQFYAHAPRAFRYLDQFFDADIPSRIIDLTHAHGDHERTHIHPLFLILLNPLGQRLRSLFEAAGASVVGSARIAAVTLCAAAGGWSAERFFRLLHDAGLAAPRAVLWTLVFGLSSSQLVFASLPEGFAFSTLSLVILFALTPRAEPPRRALVAAGVFAFGMVVTNVAAVVLVRARWLRLGRPLLALRALAAYVGLVVAITGALSLAETRLYPGTVSFLQVGRVSRTDQESFAWPTSGGDVARRAVALATNFVGFNIAAPRIVVEQQPPRTIVSFPDPSMSALRPIGWAHAAVWAALLLAASAGLRRRPAADTPLIVVLSLWLATNAALHTVFGVSLFLYAGHWTFAAVAVAALGAERVVAGRSRLAAALSLLVLLAVVLQAADNFTFLRELLQLFASSWGKGV